MNSITFGKERYHLNGAMEYWCADHIGKGGWLREYDDMWNINSIFGNTTFKFKNEKDYTWFVLRWAS
jgi:hypothetical protein